MKRWRAIVGLPAQQDIVEAHERLEERDPGAANRWFNSLCDTIGSLDLFPERCPLSPKNCFFNREIREVFHGRRQPKYRILFTVKETQVHILHVRHGARLALDEGVPDEEGVKRFAIQVPRRGSKKIAPGKAAEAAARGKGSP